MNREYQNRLFAAGEPLFPSGVWEKACTTIHKTLPSLRKISKREAFSLSLRGTSEERVRERGPPENAPPLPDPLLHFMEERELP
jgi:hypothetical protein